MAELILELRIRPGQQPVYHRLEDGVLTLGRALDNDLIVADAHVGAKQFQVSVDGGELTLVILDRTNATYRNGRYCENARQSLEVGDCVNLSQLRLRVLSPTAPVPPARQFMDTRWSRLGSWRGVIAGLMLLICCSYALFFDYQDK